MKKLMLSVLAFSTLGSAALCLPAHADEANVQTTSQMTTQVGDFNTSYQRSVQEIRTSTANRRMRRNRFNAADNTGNVQDTVQDAFQEGYDNLAEQRNVQRVRSHRSR